MKKNIIVIAIIVIAGIVWIVANNNQSTNNPSAGNYTSSSNKDVQTAPGINVGSQALDFVIQDIRGKKVKLSDFRGKYVVFAFMATWCVPCQIEAENIRKVQEENQFVVIQIGIDPRETEQDLMKFKQKIGRDDWIIAFDKNFEIAKQYKVKSFDTTVIVDPNGKIIYRDEGWPIDVKTLRDLFKGNFQQLKLGSAHEHAKISVVIKNKKVDFSQPKYQLRSPYVHFEDGDGKTLHIHAQGVVLRYFLETLNWKLENSCLKTDFTEFCNGKLKVLVNNTEKSLDYEPKGGDEIKIIYQ